MDACSQSCSCSQLRTAAVRQTTRWQLHANRTALVVIDVQASFLTKLPLATRNAMVDRIALMMRVAIALDMPIVATAEDYASGKNPGLLPQLAQLLPPGSTVHNKLVWNAYGQPDIKAALDDTGSSAFVVVGLETDVCVAQTAIGLQSAGYGAQHPIDLTLLLAQSCFYVALPHSCFLRSQLYNSTCVLQHSVLTRH